ncbi:MAG: LPS export ABC transporter periplasmic protein LptC [Nitrospirae bacterium YQR-1]
MKNAIPVIIIVATVIFYISVIRTETDLTKNVKILHGESMMENVHIYRSTSSKSVWEARVNKVTLEESRKNAKIEGIEVDFLESGLTVQAKGGFYNLSKNAVTIEGDVTAFNKDYKITSKDISVDFKNQTLSSESGVTIAGKNYTVRADSFDTSKGEIVKLNGNVKVVYN